MKNHGQMAPTIAKKKVDKVRLSNSRLCTFLKKVAPICQVFGDADAGLHVLSSGQGVGTRNVKPYTASKTISGLTADSKLGNSMPSFETPALIY
jgi:hypothetical protein